MENEINLKAGKLTLNVHFEESVFSDVLESLLEKNLEILNRKVDSLLKKEFSSLEANLNIVSDQEIKEINLEYRNKDRPTDVLSFPLQENARRGDYDEFEGHLELGDIFVAIGVCNKQAAENDLSFEQEFVHLFTHGFLHLCGYDHEENEEEDKLMRKLESDIMDEIAALK